MLVISRIRWAAALLSPLMIQPVSAQVANGPGPLVTPQWLNAHLHDKDLVILTVSPLGDFLQEHIPGARFLDESFVSAPQTRAPDALSLEMPPEAVLRETLEKKFGISDRSQIVIAPSSDDAAARAVVALHYAGLGAHTTTLDGGVGAWRKAGYALTAVNSSTPVAGHLTIASAPEVVVDHDYVAAHANSPHVKLIDARAPVFYNGPAQGPRKGGHIPGAVNLPFDSVLTPTRFFRPKAELQAIFRSAGIQPGDTVVAYCHIGSQASNIVAAAFLLGYPARLYDGSMQDWSLRNLPTEGGH